MELLDDARVALRVEAAWLVRFVAPAAFFLADALGVAGLPVVFPADEARFFLVPALRVTVALLFVTSASGGRRASRQ